MALNYRLIKFSDLVIYRTTQGHYEDGEWVAGIETPYTIKAKVQPLRDTELLSLPESERTKSWLKVYVQEGQIGTFPDVRTAQQGPDGWGPDQFVWQGFRYQVMKDRNYNDSILDHTRVFASRLEVTPN